MNTALTDKAWFKAIINNPSLVAKLSAIKLIIFDVDGTLTNAGIAIDDQGEGPRIFDIQDGYAFGPAQKAGLTIALMSGKQNISTILRGKTLGVPEELCLVGILNKPESVKKIQAILNITPEQTLAFGDDYLDAQIPQTSTVKLFACPANTPFYYQDSADLVVPRTGGSGAARLLLDLILFVQGKHFSQDAITQSLSTKTST
jgi:3-deoxy-D-manno-octulosonate 8-phosphate phosphatase (KDO 8-P phosphatase)